MKNKLLLLLLLLVPSLSFGESFMITFISQPAKLLVSAESSKASYNTLTFETKDGVVLKTQGLNEGQVFSLSHILHRNTEKDSVHLLPTNMAFKANEAHLVAGMTLKITSYFIKKGWALTHESINTHTFRGTATVTHKLAFYKCDCQHK
jgi:hypothetical protein